MAEDKWPRDIVDIRGIAQVSDAGALGAVVEAVLKANASTVEEYRAAEDDKSRKNKRNALMGAVMKELKGQGDAQVVNALLDTHLS